MILKGKRIAVTGALGGLGQQVVNTALAEGAQVIAIDYARPNADKRDSENLLILGGIDLTSEAAAKIAFETAAEHFGAIDALVNIAGGFCWETFKGSSIDSWDKMYSINVRTAVIASQAALPFLLEQKNSSVVNISANSAQKSEMGVAAYTASKAAVAKLTESLADEFKSEGLRVNAVMPSIIDTAANRGDMPEADFSTWVSPEELANVITFLLSDNASAITGALIPVVGRV